jgi:hypothetical protein
MKFSEIKKEEWPALKPYLDTCLLPVTGLDGSESPVEAAERLEELRDVLDLIERPYRGRTVTYPAWQYAPDRERLDEQLAMSVERLREVGFRHVVIVTADDELGSGLRAGADLVITPANSAEATRLIAELWR